MFLSGSQLSADFHDEHRTVLLGYRIFSFLRCFVWIHIFQFLRRDEKDFVRNFRLNVSVKSVYIVAEVLNRIVNGRNRFFQIFFGL